MNRYILKTMLCSALVAPLLTSCELDQLPETSLPVEGSWEQVSDAANYNVGLLAALRSVTGGNHRIVSEVQSDLFNARTGIATYNQVHQWTFTTSQFDGDVVWSGNYNLISNANNIINNIGNIAVEEGSDEEAALKYYKGVALFARAYAYSNMVVRYCKDYEPATAGQELGLPLIETVDVNLKPARATLAATYAFIKNDISQAKLLLTDGDDIDTENPNANALEALDARVSLYMHDWDNAIACADDLIGKYPLAQSQQEFADMWLNDEGSEIIYQPLQTLNERVNAYGAFIGYSTALEAYNPYFLPAQDVLDLYTPGDMRLSTYFAQVPASTNDMVDDNAVILNKYPGNPALKNQATDFYNMTKAFRAAEMYLIAAEASYRKDGTEGGYLNSLRTQRGADQVTFTGEALWNEIKNEWIREMVGEGFRLDCLKRWHDGFKRMQPQGLMAGFFINQDGYLNLQVDADNERFVWELPANDLQANKNLQRNWSTK